MHFIHSVVVIAVVESPCDFLMCAKILVALFLKVLSKKKWDYSFKFSTQMYSQCCAGVSTVTFFIY